MAYDTTMANLNQCNRMLKFNIEDLNILYSSAIIIRVILSGRIGRGHVSHISPEML
jgi:hypothetical protein